MFRRLLIASAVTVMATTGLAIAAAPAQAISCPAWTECTLTYYQDATLSTVVGQRLWDCSGAVSHWGTITAHRVYDSQPC